MINIKYKLNARERCCFRTVILVILSAPSPDQLLTGIPYEYKEKQKKKQIMGVLLNLLEKLRAHNGFLDVLFLCNRNE